jgi:hypothetical protein
VPVSSIYTNMFFMQYLCFIKILYNQRVLVIKNVSFSLFITNMSRSRASDYDKPALSNNAWVQSQHGGSADQVVRLVLSYISVPRDCIVLWIKWSCCTAMTKYRNLDLETNIPRKGILGSQSQFPHSCICEWFIYSHLPILLEEICRLILGLYKSLTDTWMWKLGLRPRNSQKRNT